MLTVDYETGWGERARLAICADRYAGGGALALLALDATDPGDEGYLDIWCALTVNLPGDPVASEWCAGSGHVVLDANNVPRALVDALVRAGVVELSGCSVRSGFCSYPLATVPPRALAGLRGYEETVRELTPLTVVLEWEDGDGGGAEEWGRAPRGDALAALVASASAEADALAAGGCEWAAVRRGAGGVEDVDCETGETVHVAGGR